MPRPREFDEAALITHAMNAFWSLGYKGTSVEDLVSGTGASRASLYNLYPDKRGLFIESIKHYLEDIVQDNVRRLKEVQPADEAVRQFFLNLVEAPRARLCRGCLLTNSAFELGQQDKEVATLIRQAFAKVEAALHERLAEAARAGTLADHLEPRTYARQLITLLQGIRVMARVGADRDLLWDAARSALSGLKAPDGTAAGKPPRARSVKKKRAR
jgi:TetR/AcrR family transcriptional repressor of nem operon